MYMYGGGGGGGGCASRERDPHFLWDCPNFLLQSIFSLMTKQNKKFPRNITILQFVPLWRPSFSKFLYLKAIPSPPTAHLLREAEHKTFVQHSGFTAGQSASHVHVLQISSRDPPFHVEPAPELHICMLNWACCGALQFHAGLAPKPPFCTLLWHKSTIIWAKVSPPPPPPPTLMLACKFWIKTCFGKIIMYNFLHWTFLQLFTVYAEFV